MQPTLANALSVYLAKLVLLVCWVYWEEVKCKVQNEQWDMTMLGNSVCGSTACTPSEIAT